METFCPVLPWRQKNTTKAREYKVSKLIVCTCILNNILIKAVKDFAKLCAVCVWVLILHDLVCMEKCNLPWTKYFVNLVSTFHVFVHLLRAFWYNYLQIANYCLYMYWTLTCNMRQWLAILCPHSFKTARHLLLVMQPFGVVHHERIFYTFPKKMQWLTESQSVWHTHGAWRHGKVRDNTVKHTTGFLCSELAVHVFSVFSWYRIFFILSTFYFIRSYQLYVCIYWVHCPLVIVPQN